MPEPTVEARRRGFWMRMARERADFTQTAAAKELGLQGKSKSTLSAWENGHREPKPSQLTRMAILYGVPPELFAKLDPTAYERIDERIAELGHRAIEREREDWDQAPGEDPTDEDGPDAGPGRRSA